MSIPSATRVQLCVMLQLSIVEGLMHSLYHVTTFCLFNQTSCVLCSSRPRCFQTLSNVVTGFCSEHKSKAFQCVLHLERPSSVPDCHFCCCILHTTITHPECCLRRHRLKHTGFWFLWPVAVASPIAENTQNCDLLLRSRVFLVC